jgi:hypothetical protein
MSDNTGVSNEEYWKARALRAEARIVELEDQIEDMVEREDL